MMLRLLGVLLGLAFLALTASELAIVIESNRPIKSIVSLLFQGFIGLSMLIYGLGGQKYLESQFPIFKRKSHHKK